MKGTRLWQNTGSPLISGRSRRERPFWQQVLTAWAACVLMLVAVVLAIYEATDAALVTLNPALPWWVAAIGGAVAYSVVPGALGATSGVWFARNMGWRRPWVAGMAAGLLLGLAWLALSASWL